MSKAALERLEARAAYYERRLAEGHSNKAVITRWRHDLRRTRALIAYVQDGRKRHWTQYKDEVEL
jgi:hypothetical protein